MLWNKRISMVLFFAIVTACAFSQTFQGKITDLNGAPIPFAHVKLAKSGMGTVSNDSGVFKLKIPANEEKIIISALGYQELTVKLDSIDTEKFTLLRMREATNMLEEVVIYSEELDIKELLKKVLANINKVYENKPSSQIAFFREATVRDQQYSRLVEAIIQHNQKGISRPFSSQSFEVLNIRKSVDENQLEFGNAISVWLYQKSAPYQLNSFNPIYLREEFPDVFEDLFNPKFASSMKENPTRFFNADFIELNDFSVRKKTNVEGNQIIEIEFVGSNLRTPFFENNYLPIGSMIVSRDDLAILRFERKVFAKQGEKSNRLIRSNVMADSTITNFVIEFTKNQRGKYVTHYIKESSIGTSSQPLLPTADFQSFYNSKGKLGKIYHTKEWFVLEEIPYKKIAPKNRLIYNEDIYDAPASSKNWQFFEKYDITELTAISPEMLNQLSPSGTYEDLFITP